jgi:phospholipid/cholesterol/gamma-HCH transport system substrate-binding protein
MRTGAEIKVGIITLFAVALLLVFAFYIRGFRATAVTYKIDVTFDDARGLQRGDPVRMLGVKIGQVHSVEITPELKAQVTLSIDGEQELYDHYKFRIGTSGLIQERFVEVIPAPREPYVNKLTDGASVEGIVRPDLSDLMDAGSRLLDNLDRTSRRLSLVLGDQEILTGIRDALQSFSQLANTVSVLAEQSQPELLDTLSGIRSASADLKAVATEVRTRLTEGSALDDIEETARRLREIATRAERISTDLAKLTSDPDIEQQVRTTIAAVSQAAQSAEKVGADLEVVSTKLREAAPAIPVIAEEASEFAGASAVLRQRLQPPKIDAAFDVLYGPGADRSYSSARLDIGAGQDRFLRIGIDDIGEDSTANIQLGEPQRRAVLRYGLVRSRLGIGADFDLPREITLSFDLFDPNALRADVLVKVPFVQGRAGWSLLAGARDLGEENVYVGGIRLER